MPLINFEAVNEAALRESRLPNSVNGHGAAHTADLFEINETISLRTADQQSAYKALYGDGGFSSWERALATAKAENRTSILKTATIEIFRLAARADVSHTEVADWATDLGNIHNIGDDDAIQKIIAEAKRAADTPAPCATATEQDSRSRTASGSESAATSLVIRVASEIEAEPVTWLWQSRIAVGKQTLVAGDPGLGKSQLMAYLAAVVTTGGHWPCDEGRATQGSVVIFSAEDDPADTIVPRLLAAGADLDRVRIVEAVTIDDGKGNKSRRMFHLQADLARLETVLAEVGDVRLVIIDPITAYLGGVDTHRNSDVRGVLGVVAEMAARHRVAVVVVSHWNKSGIGTAVNRVTGSGAFTAAVRAAFMVAKDPEDDERRLFVAMKNNLARIDGGLAFRIEQHMVGPGNAILASAIVWDSERVTRTADEILAAAEDVGVRSAIDEAVDWLRDLLAGNPMPAKDVRLEGDAAGYSWATLKRAKQAAAIDHFREGGAADRGRWFWRLPPPETLTGSTKAYLAQEKDVSQLAKFEPVSEMEPSRSAFDTEGGR